MYHIAMITQADVKSYASFANAVAAVEKHFGPQDAAGERHCNIMIVCTESGRFAPMCINIKPGASFSVCMASGFMMVN